MNIAMTGATGFIGGKLVQALSQQGNRIRCLVRNPEKAEKLKSMQGVELFYGDLSEPDSLSGFLDGIQKVFHIAAYVSDWGKREDFYRINVDATRQLLEQAVYFGVERFVHLSSSTVVWRSSLTEIHRLEDIDESYPYPENHYDPYNETKAESERLVKSYNGKDGLETVIIRPSNVWGDGDTVILPRLIDAASKGILHPVGYNKKTVSPCNVNNLVDSMILSASSNNAPGKIYFINDGIKIEYSKFLSDQLDAANIEWKPGFVIPYTVMYSLAAILEFIYRLFNSEKPPVLTRFAVSALAGSRTYSIHKARSELGYEPSVDYEEGISRLRRWVETSDVNFN